MEITLCSMSPTKLGAVTDAATRIWTEPPIILPDGEARSCVPNQPYGDEETLTGAMNRALTARRGPDRYIAGIESGVAPRGEAHSTDCAHVDIAYVVVLDPDGRITVRSSRCVLVPAELVALARESRWTTTCGQLEAARTRGVDHDDPHVVWSRGATSRRALLADAIEEALRAACRSRFYVAKLSGAEVAP